MYTRLVLNEHLRPYKDVRDLEGLFAIHPDFLLDVPAPNQSPHLGIRRFIHKAKKQNVVKTIYRDTSIPISKNKIILY